MENCSAKTSTEMTTDTAMALLAEGINNGYISHADECESYEGYACDCGIDEYRKRIAALLDSLKRLQAQDEAARELPEPVRYGLDLAGEMGEWCDGEYVSYSDYDTLRARCAQLMVERDAANKRYLHELETSQIEHERAEKADAENKALREDAERKIEAIDKYGFQCEAGTLENCAEWIELKTILRGGE